MIVNRRWREFGGQVTSEGCQQLRERQVNTVTLVVNSHVSASVTQVFVDERVRVVVVVVVVVVKLVEVVVLVILVIIVVVEVEVFKQ